MAESNINETTQGANESIKNLGSQLKSRLGDLPDYGRDIYSAVDRSARANPWMSIGIAGVGAFALGFLLGRGVGNGVSSVTDTMGVRPSSKLDIDDLED